MNVISAKLALGETETPLSQAIEERHDQVQSLISMGKERGYVLSGEVNDILPGEVHSSKEIGDLLLTLDRSGIDIYEDVSSAKGAGAALEAAEALEAEVKEEGALCDEGELDLTPGLLEKTNDPFRMYLREIGTVPLLTREGEVLLAKRIERGQFLVLKTITRSPIVIKEFLGIADDLRNGARSVKEILQFDDEELPRFPKRLPSRFNGMLTDW
jgi:RNA polymerase primary sigma factor